jgi:4-hydroxythreonine-4-phosphate dehydrogenase
MTFYSEPLKVMLATIHIPLSKVSQKISTERLIETITLAQAFVLDLGVAVPRIAVAGLNPHAGEHGLFGDEEERIICPAIKEAQNMGIAVSGPYPGDTVFKRAVDGEFDLVIAQYHDQGLIPLKLLAFDSAVNVTVGLPFVRTSVDHGTAFDIAGKNKADPLSLQEAIALAIRLVRTRRSHG